MSKDWIILYWALITDVINKHAGYMTICKSCLIAMGKEYSQGEYPDEQGERGDFSEAYGRLEAEMNRVASKLKALEHEKGYRGLKERQFRLFLKTGFPFGSEDGASAGDMPGERFVNKEEFLSLVNKVIMGDRLRFILRDGTGWKA